MKITVSNMCEEAPVADMDEQVANVLMTNLVKNAFVHNIEGGEINITSDSSHIRIESTGQPERLDSDKTFERFYHSAGKKSSTGLGIRHCESHLLAVRHGDNLQLQQRKTCVRNKEKQKLVKNLIPNRFFRFFSETPCIFASNKRTNNDYKP